MIWPASCIIYWTLTPPTSDFNFPLLCNDYNACIHCCGIVNIYKCKNHFAEMKGDVGMSLHEKEGEQEDA